MIAIREMAMCALIGSAILLSGCVNYKGPTSTNAANVSALKPAVSGKRTKIWSNFQVKEDCSAGAVPKMRVTSAPAHGKVDVVGEAVFPDIPKDNVRFKCNSRKYRAAVIYYTSDPAFNGSDKVDLVADWHDGSPTYTTVHIQVSK